MKCITINKQGKIKIGDDVTLNIMIDKKSAKIGIDAPKHIRIDRLEIYNLRKKNEQ